MTFLRKMKESLRKMKILWLGGIILPRIANNENLPVNNTNGWLIRISEAIGASQGVELVYLFDSDKDLRGKTDFYSYYGIKCNGSTAKKVVDRYFQKAREIIEFERPDIVHIWGTERPHTYSMVKACEEAGIGNRVIISIQGLVSVYAEHYEAYLPNKIVNRLTLRDFFKGNIAKGKSNYQKAGKFEIEALKKVHHVIGRTDWDRACAWNINPDAEYHFNNETLREEFYSGKWKLMECEPHSMFCSQGHYPIKGIHLAIKALKRIIEEFPDAKLYIGGKDYFSLPRWQLSSYSKYICDLVNELGLREHVVFTGFLSASQMKERLLKTNVFISPSSIENSPNSLGEAMLLGVPCVASDVGGVRNLMTDKEEGYIYPADEHYMISFYVCNLFRQPQIAAAVSEKAHRRAMLTHDYNNNLECLNNIYKTIIDK